MKQYAAATWKKTYPPFCSSTPAQETCTVWHNLGQQESLIPFFRILCSRTYNLVGQLYTGARRLWGCVSCICTLFSLYSIFIHLALYFMDLWFPDATNETEVPYVFLFNHIGDFWIMHGIFVFNTALLLFTLPPYFTILILYFASLRELEQEWWKYEGGWT